MLKAIRVSQLVWAGLLLTLLFFDAFATELVATGTLLVLALIYVIVAILALGSNRIVWLSTLVVPVILCATAAVNVVRVIRDEPYVSERVIAYVVVGNTLLFLLPFLLLLALFWRQRAAVGALLRASSAPRYLTKRCI